MGAPGSIVFSCPVCAQRLRLPSGLGQARVTCPSCRHQWSWAGGSDRPDQGAEPDYYELLQVSVRAETDVIEAAYRRLAKRYHPDRNPGDDRAAAMMVLLNRAREILTDPRLRAEYDSRRATSGSVRGVPDPDAPRPAPNRPEPPRETTSHHRAGGRVQISARLIHWPQQCACCFGPFNDYYRATYTRVTGKKVIRTDSRWWDVPYCSECLDHLDAHARAKSISSASAYSVLVFGILIGLVVALCGTCCVGPAAFAPTKAVDDRRERGKRAEPDPGKREASKTVLVVFMLGSVVAGAGLAVGSYFWYQRLEADTKRRRRRAMSHADSLSTETCCTLGPAVVYEGWYGSVHTFWFANPDYADAFVQANPGKVLLG